mgnify:FL=1
MESQLTEAPLATSRSFLDFPLETELSSFNADIAILGIPFGKPYAFSAMANDQSRAPDAIRQATDLLEIKYTKEHYDFDLGGPLLDGRNIRIVDCGNVRAILLQMRRN